MDEWLKVAQNLPIGGKARYVHCPSTSNSSGIVSFDGKRYTMHCFKCGETLTQFVGVTDFQYKMKLRELNKAAMAELLQASVKLPGDFTLDIPPVGLVWLLKASILPTQARMLGIGWSERWQRVVLPLYADGKLKYFQARAVLKGQQPKYVNPQVDRSKLAYWVIPDGADMSHVIVTEDILSAIRVGKFAPAVSLMGTKASAAHVNALTEYKHVVTWLDPDDAGQTGAAKIRKAVSILTKTSNIVSTVDPKNLTDAQIEEILNEQHIPTHRMP